MIPTKLSDITLLQWVKFHNLYGKDLEQRHNAMLINGNDHDRIQWEVDNAICHYCFYSKVNPQTITNDKLSEVLAAQFSSFAALKQEEIDLNYADTFSFDGKQWQIHPVIANKGQLSREEFEISQDIALIFSDLQDGRTEAIYELCAAFLRNVGEPYSNTIIADRTELMKQLPLNIALATKHYIEDSISLYLQSVNV